MALESGKGVSKAMLIKFLQTHMKRLFPQVNVREWTGLRAGVSGEVIQKLGNWVSDIYKGYIDHSVVDVYGAQTLMAQRCTSNHMVDVWASNLLHIC